MNLDTKTIFSPLNWLILVSTLNLHLNLIFIVCPKVISFFHHLLTYSQWWCCCSPHHQCHTLREPWPRRREWDIESNTIFNELMNEHRRNHCYYCAVIYLFNFTLTLPRQLNLHFIYHVLYGNLVASGKLCVVEMRFADDCYDHNHHRCLSCVK